MIPYSVDWTLVYFQPIIAYVAMIIESIGWFLLVSGQSVVLYSRLHLVLNNANILRAILWMIIANAVLWHTSITVLLFGSAYSPHQNRSGFNAVYNVLEKVQMTVFCVQEFIISGLSIKLKLEFAILSKLVKFVQHRGDASSVSTSHCHIAGPVPLSGAQPHTKDRKARVASMPEVIHMEELQTTPRCL